MNLHLPLFHSGELLETTRQRPLFLRLLHWIWKAPPSTRSGPFRVQVLPLFADEKEKPCTASSEQVCGETEASNSRSGFESSQREEFPTSNQTAREFDEQQTGQGGCCVRVIQAVSRGVCGMRKGGPFFGVQSCRNAGLAARPNGLGCWPFL